MVRIVEQKNVRKLSTLISAIIGIVTAISTMLMSSYFVMYKEKKEPTEILINLDRAERSFKDTLKYVEKLKSEIENEHKVIEDLRTEHETLKDLLGVEKEKADAILELVRRDIKGERYFNMGIGVMGGIIAILVHNKSSDWIRRRSWFKAET